MREEVYGRKGESEIESDSWWKRDGEGKKEEERGREKKRRRHVWELFYGRLREAKYVYELMARRAPGIAVPVAVVCESTDVGRSGAGATS